MKNEIELQCKELNKEWKTFHYPDSIDKAKESLAWNENNARANGSKKEFRILVGGKEHEIQKTT